MSRRRRLQRPEFEAITWEYAPRTTSGDARERIAAHDVIMRAFDAATGHRPYCPQAEAAGVRAAAEAARAYAAAVNRDNPVSQAGRRAELEAALNARKGNRGG